MAGAGPAILAGGFGALGTGMETYTSIMQQKLESDYKRQQLELNARLANIQAEDALTRGSKEAAALRGQTRKLIGSQRVALAAQGINIESGSAAEVQADTAAAGAADELTIKSNAYREAFGYRAQALQYGNQAAFTGIASTFNQRATLLTGGYRMASQIAGAYGRYAGGK